MNRHPDPDVAALHDYATYALCKHFDARATASKDAYEIQYCNEATAVIRRGRALHVSGSALTREEAFIVNRYAEIIQDVEEGPDSGAALSAVAVAAVTFRQENPARWDRLATKVPEAVQRLEKVQQDVARRHEENRGGALSLSGMGKPF